VSGACLRGRTLELTLPGGQVLELPLDHGEAARIVVSQSDGVLPILQSLEPLAGVSVLPVDGGLLGGMPVTSQFVLALGQQAGEGGDPRAAWEHRLLLAWQLCGVAEAEARRLGRALPQALTRGERWLAGLVLQMLRPLDVLVLDRPYAQLSRSEMGRATACLEAFRRLHPFRPLLLLDVDVPGLPELSWLRETVAWEDAPCPC
jgi:hypothetical protein